MKDEVEATDLQVGTPTLRRALSLPMMTAYGIGVTVGAGIYVLAGTMIGVAGTYAPISFLVAAGLVTFAALSFAELSARLPFSAGEAVYVTHGLRLPALGTAVGLLVALAGIVSAATIVQGFAGYVRELVELPATVIVLATVVLLSAVAAWGIREAVAVAAALTVLEVGGLLLVIWSGRAAFSEVGDWAGTLAAGADGGTSFAIASGAVLAFFAFIGFEGMVNVAEEVRDVGRTMPRAIVLTVTVTTVLYVAVALVAILAVPPELVAGSPAPLARIYEHTSGGSSAPVVLIGILAIVNGALIQIIMGSRVLYGLAAQRRLPAALARIHPRTRTPVHATAVIGMLVAVFVAALPLETLARVTSLVVLIVFALVCVALVAIKRRAEPPRPRGIDLPIAVPAVGVAVCTGLAGFQLLDFLDLV